MQSFISDQVRKKASNAAATLILASAAVLGLRLWDQHTNEVAMRIDSVNGVQESMFVDIGGLPQWIQIRGENRENPVLLFIHGGPASSTIPIAWRAMHQWEHLFTIVQWDQRGAGRTYLRNGSADTTSTGMQQIVDDGLQLSEYLRDHLHRHKIIVMGLSSGSAVGLEMARQRPDLFYAFVGTGQEIAMERAGEISYQLLLERMRKEGNQAELRRLQQIGSPPYRDSRKEKMLLDLLSAHAPRSESGEALLTLGSDILTAPGYDLGDLYSLVVRARHERNRLVADNQHYDALQHGSNFSVPLFFFQGTDDMLTPLPLVSEFVDKVDAPQKTLVTFAGGGHSVWYFKSDDFLAQLTRYVQPLTML